MEKLKIKTCPICHITVLREDYNYPNTIRCTVCGYAEFLNKPNQESHESDPAKKIEDSENGSKE